VGDSREQVFTRIREALRVPAPRHAHGATGEGLPVAESFRAWLPLVGSTVEEQVALFRENVAALRAEFFVCSSMEETAVKLAELAREASWQRVATHRTAPGFELARGLGLPCLVTDEGYVKEELETCDAAITGCDALVAQTGSVLVSGPSAGGRALSVLPPHHVVVARRGQVVPDLAAALRGARERYPVWPSFLSFITGPSRTGDIERILVLGAHGPRRVTIFLVP